MEKALYISKVENLMHYENGFSRLYFGQEFCQELIPSPEDLDIILSFVRGKGLQFSLVTPFVTDRGLGKVELLLKKLNEEEPYSEVIINDWGVLCILNGNYSKLEPVLGRLLVKIKRDPRIVHILDKISKDCIEYFQGTNLKVPAYIKFLKEREIGRVELDNVLQGINLNFSDKIKVSLHLPFVFVSTTRLCLVNSCDIPDRWEDIGIFPCKKECQKYTFYLRNPVMPVVLIRKGNTLFFKNEQLGENIEKERISRIVISPEIPL